MKGRILQRPQVGKSTAHELKVLPNGDVHVRIGGEPRFPGRSIQLQEALVNRVAFKEEESTGSTLAQIQTVDTKRHPHTVSPYLNLRGDTLNGRQRRFRCTEVSGCRIGWT